MPRFASEAELEIFLARLDPDCSQFASALWQNGVRTVHQLANALDPILLSCGLPELYIDDIKARTDRTVVRTLDDVTIISEATARAFHRLKQKEESEREETICCTASSTPFATAEAAAQKLGFQVKTVDCDLAPNARVHPLQPVYVWEQNEDSVHEKPKVLARLNEELALSNTELQATAVFAKPLAVVQRRGVRLSARTDVVIHPATTTFRATQGQLNRYLQIWELRTTKALERGTGPNDIVHIQFKNLEEAYAHIRWLLDRSKAENPDLRLDLSLAPPAVGMFTIMKHQAHSKTDSMSADDRLLSKECDADDQSILRNSESSCTCWQQMMIEFQHS